jgi:glycosyltransferase involved in cell wall biosynthesis
VVADWLCQASVPTTVLGVRNMFDALKLSRLVGMLRDRRIDILHTHLFHADLAGRLAAYLAGAHHVVHTIHTAEKRFRPWQFAFARMAASMCDRMVAVSPSARDYHARASGLPLSRYTVIFNGIDTVAYQRDQQARQKYRQLWGVLPEEVLVAFVGRLSHEKGLETLLEAMCLLAGLPRPPKLVIAGQGPRRKLIESFVASQPAGRLIRLLGHVSDVRGVLSAADIFAMPSRWEGFGLAAAEAMAASLPVVASQVEGLKDLLVDGQTALLVDMDDAESLAARIARLSQDAAMRESLGQMGRQRVIHHFSIAANVAAHQSLYLELVASRR